MSDLIRQRTDVIKLLSLIPYIRIHNQSDCDAECSWRDYNLRFYHSKCCLFDIECMRTIDWKSDRKNLSFLFEDEPEPSDDVIVTVVEEYVRNDLSELLCNTCFNVDDRVRSAPNQLNYLLRYPESVSWKRVTQDLAKIIERIRVSNRLGEKSQHPKVIFF